MAELPLIHRILLENIVRNGGDAGDAARRALVDAVDRPGGEAELPFLPGRVMMHDTTCGPALVDIAALRDVLAEAGGDPTRLNPAYLTITGRSGAQCRLVETYAKAHRLWYDPMSVPRYSTTVVENAFLASPPLVIAFALAGDAAIDVTADALGRSLDGRDICLADLWPTSTEIDAATAACLRASDVESAHDRASRSEAWRSLEAPTTARFPWNAKSTYLRRPPFVAIQAEVASFTIEAHPLLVLGDDITTDHISPAGQISATSAAGQYLIERGENPRDLNVFVSRRGNWEVMVRGLFTNKSVRNLLDPILSPGETIHAKSGARLPLWQAAERYRVENRATVIIAGERYGMGSSRDWAAKGVALLGVRAVIAKSFERIHRSNLIGMGVLPLKLPDDGVLADLKADDIFVVDLALGELKPRGMANVHLHSGTGKPSGIWRCRMAIETAAEIHSVLAGGTLPGIASAALKQRGHA